MEFDSINDSDLTVVICSHNRRALLANSLESVYNAAIPADCSANILVVANACTDDTVSWAQQFKENHKSSPLVLHVVEEPVPGKSYALNRAISILKCSIAIFIDDDQKVDKNFFIEAKHALDNHPESKILCGKLLPDWREIKTHWTNNDGPYSVRPSPIPTYDLGNEIKELTEYDELPPGGNLIIRDYVWRRIGRFDTTLGPKGHDLMGGEDTQFLRRAIDEGFSIMYIPTIIQYHYVDPERLQLGYLMRKAFQRSRAINRIRSDGPDHIPAYFWNKLFQHTARALFSWRLDRTRYYLIRVAATLGEIRGIMDHYAKDK